MDEHQAALNELERLRVSGALSDEEYQSRRSEVLKRRADAAKPWRYLFYGMVAVPVLFVGGCFALLAFAPEDDGNSGGAALVACHNSVKAQLRSPGTAKFNDDSMTEVGERWVIRGSVDAENAFGATVRTRFVCEGTAQAMRATLSQ